MRQSGAFALNFMADAQVKEAGQFGKKYAKVGAEIVRDAALMTSASSGTSYAG